MESIENICDIDKFSDARVERAVELFHMGYNCSQSVACAWADCYGLTVEQMALVASSFGGGIGRMRLTCGAACGMFILAGLEYGYADPKDKERKNANYAIVQELARRFTSANGNLQCGALLRNAGITPHTSSTSEERTPEYYKKRPCPKIIEAAARIWLEYIREQKG